MEKRNPLHTISGNVRAIVGKSMESPQKIKNRTIIWPNNPTSWYISKGNEIKMLKRPLQSPVYCSTILNSQEIEITQVSINQWMGKDIYKYTNT
jgi:hypothetical protein